MLLSIVLLVLSATPSPSPWSTAQDGTKPAPQIPADTQIQETPSGLKYSVLVAGPEGRKPKFGDNVKVHYSGWLTEGKLFDSSVQRGEPSEFTLGQMMEGLNEALSMMTIGSRWKLTIPPKLGFAERGYGKDIPPNATLIYELELLGCTFMPEFHPARPEKTLMHTDGIKYEVLSEGQGESPAAGQAVELRYAMFNSAGKLLDCSERGMTIKGRPDRLPLAFIAKVTPLLKPGARLRFEVPPEHCFGARPQGRDLPPNSITVWELELMRTWTPQIPAFVPTPADKLQTTASGLQYEILKTGSGATPRMGSIVTLHFAGWLTDGTLFDSSYERDEPSKYRLGQVIQGWNEGLQLMQEGAIYQFTVPTGLAYGKRGSPPAVPPDATLVFRIELVHAGRR